MLTGETDYRRILKRELERRCGAIPKYSLRAFARDLKLAPSRLSEVLSGKQGLSRECARQVATTIGLAPGEIDVFCDLVDAQHARGQVSRELARLRLEKHKIDQAFHTVDLDAFAAVSDWYHFAILQVVALPGAKGDPKWIAKALGITPIEAKEALERLERLELISREGSKVVSHQEFVSTPDGTPSTAIRKFHRQILERALAALDAQPVDDRNFSVMMMPIDKAKLTEAKRWVRNFRRRFARKVSDSPSTTDVYCLSVQFFNLTHTKGDL